MYDGDVSSYFFSWFPLTLANTRFVAAYVAFRDFILFLMILIEHNTIKAQSSIKTFFPIYFVYHKTPEMMMDYMKNLVSGPENERRQ